MPYADCLYGTSDDLLNQSFIQISQAIAKVYASWKLFEHSNGFRGKNAEAFLILRGGCAGHPREDMSACDGHNDRYTEDHPHERDQDDLPALADREI